ncbi:MAG: MFS transporter [bacterium]|nr:MFS transporter [bacterium]
MNSVNNQVKILSLGFFLLFFGFGAVQYYQVVYFSAKGMAEVGFWSLILIYAFFALFSPLAAVLVARYGAKRCMIFASPFYSFFILTLLVKSVSLVYLASIFLGIAASLLWVGQNSYLIRASDKKSYGSNSGFFNVLVSLGGGLGLIILGFLVSRFSFGMPFLFYAVFPIIGFLSLFLLSDLRMEQKQNYFLLIKKAFTSATALKLASIGFIVNFILGLTLGIIPIEIKNTLGLFYVGVLSSLIYVFPILFSYFSGKLSDIQGREKIIFFSYSLLLLGLISLIISSKPLFLILGIVALTLNWAIIRPILYALAGDITPVGNLESIIALFWTIQNLGVLSALVISQIWKNDMKIVYLISIVITAISFFILLPLLKLRIEKIKEKISQEMLS